MKIIPLSLAISMLATVAPCCGEDVVAIAPTPPVEPDNRVWKPITSLPFVLEDEVEVRDSITSSTDEALKKELGLTPASKIKFGGFRLKWNRRIALKDADYVLCLFDASTRMYPGNNPRVLILFNLNYQIVTWGTFICEPRFDYGTIVNRTTSPNTVFITVNPSDRFGGVLYFEKYLISPKGVKRLGEGYELGKIADPAP